MYIYIYIYTYVHISLSIYIDRYKDTSIYLSIYLSIYHSINQSIYLSIYLSTCMPLSLSRKISAMTTFVLSTSPRQARSHERWGVFTKGGLVKGGLAIRHAFNLHIEKRNLMFCNCTRERVNCKTSLY